LGKGTILIRLSAPADNTTLGLKPFGKQPVSITGLFDCSPAVSPMKNVDQNAASLERLDGVRILGCVRTNNK
jgi:hypothetical protein